MRFGIFLPGGTHGHVISNAIPSPGEVTYDYHRRLVLLAEELGFDARWLL